MSDHVSKILTQWSNVRPDLDCSPMGVIGRISRINKLLSCKVEEVICRYDMSLIEFDILATLRRADCPLTPTELYKTTMLSSGAVSSKLDKLVKCGWVERLHNETDRRSCRAMLTAAGVEAVDEALNAHVANERKLLESLTLEEQTVLAGLLSKWLSHDEKS